MVLVLLVDNLHLPRRPDGRVPDELDNSASSHRQIPIHQHYPLGQYSRFTRLCQKLHRSDCTPDPAWRIRSMLSTYLHRSLQHVVSS